MLIPDTEIRLLCRSSPSLLEPFTEEHLIGFAYDFEQATTALRAPAHTPSLDGASK